MRESVCLVAEPRGGRVAATVLVVVNFWANGEWRDETINRYVMAVHDAHLSDVRPA
jgi:hypothetical protein